MCYQDIKLLQAAGPMAQQWEGMDREQKVTGGGSIKEEQGELPPGLVLWKTPLAPHGEEEAGANAPEVAAIRRLFVGHVSMGVAQQEMALRGDRSRGACSQAAPEGARGEESQNNQSFGKRHFAGMVPGCGMA